ncbi:hypothetical protein [Sphingomonas bacterium]|uniref:hypothetical protein n=1 Tax=Sphingomonas bacterium TaxID=1895847 RepID=UPI0015754652|nr:hypothetical protein [Sphingomonas bacterium]
MPWHAYVYNVLLLSCCLYAAVRGGAPERADAAIILLGSALTFLSYSPPAARFHAVEELVFMVDMAVLVAFAAVSQLADRFWPMAVTGAQLAGISVHVIKALAPDVAVLGYSFALALPAYIMLGCIAAGVYRHQRRLAATGRDPSWIRRCRS